MYRSFINFKKVEWKYEDISPKKNSISQRHHPYILHEKSTSKRYMRYQILADPLKFLLILTIV